MSIDGINMLIEAIYTVSCMKVRLNSLRSKRSRASEVHATRHVALSTGTVDTQARGLRVNARLDRSDKVYISVRSSSCPKKNPS